MRTGENGSLLAKLLSAFCCKGMGVFPLGTGKPTVSQHSAISQMKPVKWDLA